MIVLRRNMRTEVEVEGETVVQQIDLVLEEILSREGNAFRKNKVVFGKYGTVLRELLALFKAGAALGSGGGRTV